MKILIILFSIFLLNSCGKAEGDSINECHSQIVSGRECIVCDHGGVSCNWGNQ